MIPKFVLLTLFSFCCFAAFSQTVDCFKFKEGKFRSIDPNVGSVTIIERRANYQTESNEGLKLQIRFNLTWLDNCTYTLKIDRVLRNENKIDIPKMELKVKIVETNKDSYVQESSSTLYPNIYRSTVTKIN